MLAIEIRKTRNTLLPIAAIALASDPPGLAVLNAFVFEAILIIIIVPAILVGSGFLALKESLTAIIIAAIMIIGVWIYTIITIGARAASWAG